MGGMKAPVTLAEPEAWRQVKMAIVWRARLLCGQFCSDNGPAASCAGCGAGHHRGLARGRARAAGGGGAVKAIPTAYAGI